MVDGRARVAIVDDNVSFSKTLAEYIASHSSLDLAWVAENGVDALTMLARDSVDVMVLDVVMPYLDGIGVLERLKEMHLPKRPKVVMLTAMGHEGSTRVAMALGADYYVMKPCDLEVLVSRIEQICSYEGQSMIGDRQVDFGTTEARAVLEGKVRRALVRMGVAPHMKGYKYLVDAITMVLEDPSILGQVTTRLYPGVAQLHATEPTRVDRAIRHAIGLIWTRPGIPYVERLFGLSAESKTRRPANSEFIARVAEAIRLGDD